jgi:hypothetical protein
MVLIHGAVRAATPFAVVTLLSALSWPQQPQISNLDRGRAPRAEYVG